MGSLVSDFVCSISGEIEGAPNSVKAPNGSVINGHLNGLCVLVVFLSKIALLMCLLILRHLEWCFEVKIYFFYPLEGKEGLCG